MIKKYFDFISIIKENNNSDIKDIFLSNEDIDEFFYELLDYGWVIYIDRGIFLDGDFYEVFSPGYLNKGYKINIEIPGRESGYKEDVTFSFRSSVLRIASFTNSDYYIIPDHYNDDRVLLNDIELKEGQIIIENKIQKNYNGIFIYIFSKEKIYISDIQVANHYNWNYDDSDDKGNIYVVYDNIVELVKLFLSEEDDNYKFLTDPESIYDNYHSYDYDPDIDSLFRYYLSKENINKLLEKLIENNGGYEEVINIFYDDEYTKEQLYSFLLKNPKELKELDEVDLLDEIKSLCGSYLMDAHIEKNMKELDYSFINKLNKTVDLTEIEDDNKTLFKIKFNKDWYIDRDYDYLDLNGFKHIADLMYEWIHHEGMQFTINTYFSDYGNMDEKEFNKEVAGYFK